MSYVTSATIIIIPCNHCYADNRVIKTRRTAAKCGNCGCRLLPPTTDAVNFFVQTLIGLSSRLKGIRRKLMRNSIHVALVERELNTCAALLQKLYSHASQHNIRLQDYCLELSEIDFLSNDIKDEVELKSKRTLLQRMTWKGALNATIKITNIILMILGAPTFLHPLPEGTETRLLEDGSQRRRNRSRR